MKTVKGFNCNFKLNRETRKITELINNVKNSYQTLVTNSLRSSEEEHKVNALALGAEEGRGKLR